MNLGNLTLSGRLIVAPLAGISDLPFRLMARRCGAALVCSEMVSAHGLVYDNRSTVALLKTDPEERPFSVQLFGASPEVMGRAAALLSDRPIDVLDINMGCPVKKVVSRGAGASLLRDLPLARAVIRAVVRNTQLPVTVKMRAGWSREAVVAPELALMAQDEGVSGVVIHGRTARQFFSGSVDFEYITRVCESVSIPVIGNGDVTNLEQAAHMMQETGCQAVMIGRGALGRPWVFSQGRPALTPVERLSIIDDHLALMQEHLSVHEALVAARKHVGWYVRGMRGAAGFRKSLYEMKSTEEIRGQTSLFFSLEVPGPS